VRGMEVGGGSARSPLSQVHPAKRTEAPSQIRARTLKIVIPRSDAFYTPHRLESTPCLSLLLSSQGVLAGPMAKSENEFGACRVYGDPTLATREKGALVVEAMVDFLVRTLNGLSAR